MLGRVWILLKCIDIYSVDSVPSELFMCTWKEYVFFRCDKNSRKQQFRQIGDCAPLLERWGLCGLRLLGIQMILLSQLPEQLEIQVHATVPSRQYCLSVFHSFWSMPAFQLSRKLLKFPTFIWNFPFSILHNFQVLLLYD